MADKRQHALRRARALDPNLSQILAGTWQQEWPSLLKDDGWDEGGDATFFDVLEVFELAQWCIDTPVVILDGRSPGKLCSASLTLRAEVSAKISALSVTKRKALEAQCKRLGIPNVQAPQFTTALGRWLLKTAIPAL